MQATDIDPDDFAASIGRSVATMLRENGIEATSSSASPVPYSDDQMWDVRIRYGPGHARSYNIRYDYKKQVIFIRVLVPASERQYPSETTRSVSFRLENPDFYKHILEIIKTWDLWWVNGR